MTENYLQIMTESLEKKLEILDQVYEVNKRQLQASTIRPFDPEAYDVIMDEKGKLIDELNRLDDGFTSTYELVREAVQSDPDRYRDKIQQMQELVREAVDKGVSIEAQEQRNKASMEAALTSRRQELKVRKVTANAATKYYNAVSKLNNVDPQLMDSKK